MNRRRVMMMLLCCVILAVLISACDADDVGRRYTIVVYQKAYWCDSYEWDGGDLMLFSCGLSGDDETIINASNVTITDHDVNK